MDNLEEIGKFFKKLSLPRLNQEEIQIMYRPITSTEIETVIKKKNKTPKKKSPGPDDFTCEFYQMFGKELMPIFLRIFQKVAEEKTLPNSFYEATLPLIPKPDKDITHTKKEAKSQCH